MAAANAITASSDLRTQVVKLGATEREELLRHLESFDRLGPEDKRNMCQLHRQLNDLSNRDSLLGILLRYSEWLRSLPAGQRVELLGLPTPERIDEITRLVQQQERQRLDEFAERGLRAADRDAILAWMNGVIRRREGEILSLLLPEVRRRAVRMDGADRRRMLILTLRRRAVQQRDFLQGLEFSAAEIDKLSARLSLEAGRTLHEVPSDAERRALQRRWITAAFVSRMTARIRSDELMQFWKSLDTSQRDSLERLPRDRMRSELQRMLIRQRFR